MTTDQVNVESQVKRRTPEQRQALAAEAWERKQRGWNHERVARDLGVSVMTVSKLLKQFYGYVGKTGFGGNMDPALSRTISRMGGKAAQERGVGHRWTREEAQAASLHRAKPSRHAWSRERHAIAPLIGELKSEAVLGTSAHITTLLHSITAEEGSAVRLTDEQWALVEPLLTALPRRADNRGRPWHDSRAVLEGILWVLFKEASWSAMPTCYPNGGTCSRRFRRWAQDGSLDQVLRALARADRNSPPQAAGLEPRR